MFRILFPLIIATFSVEGGRSVDTDSKIFNRRLTRRCHALCREMVYATNFIAGFAGQSESIYAGGSEDYNGEIQDCYRVFRQCKQSVRGDLSSEDHYQPKRLKKRCHAFCRGLRGALNSYRINAVNGRWNSWGDWGSCSRSCDQGTKSRSRTCNGPYHGGNNCQGDRTQSTSCKIKDCPRKECKNKGSIGGNGGEPFDDNSSASGKRITGVKIVCGHSYVEQIQVKYGSTWIRHPNYEPTENLGKIISSNFDDDEYITSVHGISDNMIRGLSITTNKRELKCPMGNVDVHGAHRSEYYGHRLLYISGRSGAALDRLTLHWEC